MNIGGFYVKNWVNFRPREDSHGYELKHNGSAVLAVADGITRDPLKMLFLPDISKVKRMMTSPSGKKIKEILSHYSSGLKELPGTINFYLNYPNPSPAKRSSEIMVNHFIDYLSTSNVLFNELNQEIVMEGYKEANMGIRFYNESLGIRPDTVDYLEKDYAGCVAAGAIVDEKREYLAYGFIADCRIRVFNEKGDLVLETPNEGPNSKGSIDDDIKKKFGANFSAPLGRRIIRESYRNKIKERLSYGALTGEDNALSYVKTGCHILNENDRIILHTDGLEEAVVSGEFIDALRNSDVSRMQKFCKKRVHSEGSLVYYF